MTTLCLIRLAALGASCYMPSTPWRREADEYYKPETPDHFRHWHDFAKTHLFGIEINEEIARVAKMNMIVHDDGHSNVIGADALDRMQRINEVNRGFAKDKFDLISTNPPFGAQVKATERPYLSDYDLGKQTDTKGRTKPHNNQKTEILFLERIWNFLKPDTGRALPSCCPMAFLPIRLCNTSGTSCLSVFNSWPW